MIIQWERNLLLFSFSPINRHSKSIGYWKDFCVGLRHTHWLLDYSGERNKAK